MAQEIYPTENDVGGDGKGRVTTEVTWGRLFGLVSGALTRHGGINWVQQGLTVTTPSGSQADIAAGDCVINGYQVHTTTSSSVSLTDNSTNHIYLTLSRISGKVTGQTGVVQTGTTVPSDSVLLAKVVVSGGSVTSNTDMRPRSPKGKWGSYSGTGSAQSIVLGFQPVMLVILGNDYFGVIWSGASQGWVWDSTNGSAVSSASTAVAALQLYGFSVGAGGSDPQVNASGQTYEFFAMGI